MKNFKILLFPILFFLISFAGLAQQGNGGWSGNNSYSRLFNPKTIVELKGTITSIEKIIPTKGMSNGIHLTIKIAKKESYSVHLGPQWYLDNQSIKFRIGDVIIVKGSQITYKNAPTIIAVTVEKGKTILTLRDKNGFPVWSGGGNRSNN
ncbi:hypothetical protein [Flavobacterium limnophilum]|uniref:hypothetical protein n=1 Tax=Flavobacterium limnophilum TaxID=3003262 RepID=UPI002482857A|nr:hypothetical protein [Flavobacterium limnophilum]